jgi:hypothetical protein
VRSAVLAVVLAATSSALAFPPDAELVTAVRGGDASEIERVARRFGAKRLLAALSSPGRDVLYAAIEAAPRADSAWTLLPRLGELMVSPDRPLAAGAARAAARVTRRYGRDALLREEAPPDEISRVAVTCAHAARKKELWADVRVHALECANALAGALGDDAPEAARGAALALLGDADAQLRRAAVELLAPPASDETRRKLATLARDPDATVAAAAVGALCADDPRGALRLLGQNGAARAAELERTPGLDKGTAATLRPCLQPPRGRRKR